MAEARKRPELAGVMTTALFGVPQVGVKVDNAKAMTQQIPLNDLYQTVQTFMGGSLVNFFNRFGLQWQVYVQADGDYRTKAENLGKFYVRNAAGEMTPLSTLTSVYPRSGAEFVMRYNLFNCVQINASAAPDIAPDRPSPRWKTPSARPCRHRWALTTWACRIRR